MNDFVERDNHFLDPSLKHGTVVRPTMFLASLDIKRRNRSKWLGFWISTKPPGGGFWSGLFERCWGHQRRLFLKVWKAVSASRVACEKEV